jgi:hypothetical protein
MTIKNIIQKFFILFFNVIFSMQLFAFELYPQRRTLGENNEFGWLLAPVPISVEGVGSGILAMTSLSNAWQKTDIFAAKTLPGSEFDMVFASIDEQKIFFDNLRGQFGHFEGEFYVKSWNRGIDSDKDQYIVPFSQQAGDFYQVKFFHWEKRLELLAKYSTFRSDTTKYLDSNGQKHNIDSDENTFSEKLISYQLDLTDDFDDPRKGFRMGQKLRIPTGSDENISEYNVLDTNISFYVPFFKNDTLVLNLFQSRANVTKKAETNRDILREKIGLGCSVTMADYQSCLKTENQIIDERVSLNSYGTAQPLGGTNRMRAYAMNRFQAGNSSYYGMEYRMNFTLNKLPVNWYLIGGIQSNIQLAFFVEQGTVSDDVDQLNKNMKYSSGIGIRTMISGLVYRFDIAVGDEGVTPSFFFFYPLDLNPVN